MLVKEGERMKERKGDREETEENAYAGEREGEMEECVRPKGSKRSKRI